MPEIAFSFVATLLVLYGNEINRWIRSVAKPYHFILRVTVFIVICGFGYGLATSKLTDYLEHLLVKYTGSWLFVIVLLVFIGLGVLADRRNQV